MCAGSYLDDELRCCSMYIIDCSTRVSIDLLRELYLPDEREHPAAVILPTVTSGPLEPRPRPSRGQIMSIPTLRARLKELNAATAHHNRILAKLAVSKQRVLRQLRVTVASKDVGTYDGISTLPPEIVSFIFVSQTVRLRILMKLPCFCCMCVGNGRRLLCPLPDSGMTLRSTSRILEWS